MNKIDLDALTTEIFEDIMAVQRHEINEQITRALYNIYNPDGTSNLSANSVRKIARLEADNAVITSTRIFVSLLARIFPDKFIECDEDGEEGIQL